MKEDPKSRYGDEYPAAVTIGGIRMPLQEERRFSRRYFNAEKSHAATVPRFFDDSAKINLVDLQNEWPTWTKAERSDFVNACPYMEPQDDLGDILRFVMKTGDEDDRNAIALSVSYRLPKEEAFAILLEALTKANGQHTANLTQALAATKHPNAVGVLRKHLELLWKSPNLWEDAPFTNWNTFDALCCIQQLIDLGVSPSEFEEQVRRLSTHPCKNIRESSAGYLSQHYPWLRRGT